MFTAILWAVSPNLVRYLFSIFYNGILCSSKCHGGWLALLVIHYVLNFSFNGDLRLQNKTQHFREYQYWIRAITTCHHIYSVFPQYFLRIPSLLYSIANSPLFQNILRSVLKANQLWNLTGFLKRCAVIRSKMISLEKSWNYSQNYLLQRSGQIFYSVFILNLNPIPSSWYRLLWPRSQLKIASVFSVLWIIINIVCHILLAAFLLQILWAPL